MKNTVTESKKASVNHEDQEGVSDSIDEDPNKVNDKNLLIIQIKQRYSNKIT